MPTLSPLTDKMLAFAEVPSFRYDEAVDWAVDMLMRGYDTPNLLILAGLSKPTNQWEALGYLRAAVRELGLSFEEGEAAMRRHLQYLVGRVAASHRDALIELYREFTGTDYSASLQDLLSVHWAWEDFDLGATFSYYWPAATPQTIRTWMLAVAGRWLEEAAGISA
ncbi:MAG: hypothetical protein ACRYFK_08750 [Janthinobacterium lividum]